MKRTYLNFKAIKALIRPETDLEHALLLLPEFEFGLNWGEPRFGHPEGKVAYHVREVLDNVDQIPDLSELARTQLRLVTLVHDTFKFQEDRSSPRNWHQHHGAIARRFMEAYTSDQVVLDLIECHDDAYYAWLNERRSDSNLHHKTLGNLQLRLGYCMQIYYLFFKCDTQTGDKTQAPVRWFEQHFDGIGLIQTTPK